LPSWLLSYLLELAEHIDYYLDELDRAFEESNLPDYVGNYDELEDWLIGVRLAGV